MRYVIFDTEENVDNLLPITFTRPVSHIRLGILTIQEKWERRFNTICCLKTVKILDDVYHCDVPEDVQALYIASNVLPDDNIFGEIRRLKSGTALQTEDGTLIAFNGSWKDRQAGKLEVQTSKNEVKLLRYVFDIFLLNHKALIDDYQMITFGRRSNPISQTNTIIGDFVDDTGMQMVFVEDGARVEGAVINLREGPVYIGKNAEIMEGCCIRGPLALCDSAKLKMGAKVYGATTLGPYCKAGGELNNVVMLGYSNKAHDGFLGNAVIGEWCNIGAGVNASNLKNDYSKIRIWNYSQHTFMRTDLQFCGLIMGDHSKAGVNCMFNTATVLGVGVNVHGCGFPRVFVPSFSEGSASGGFSDVSLRKFFDIAERVMGRRGKTIGETERKVFEHVYEASQKHK